MSLLGGRDDDSLDRERSASRQQLATRRQLTAAQGGRQLRVGLPPVDGEQVAETAAGGEAQCEQLLVDRESALARVEMLEDQVCDLLFDADEQPWEAAGDR